MDGCDAEARCLEPAGDNHTHEYLNVFHPQIQKFFDPGKENSVAYFKPPKLLADELRKSVWRAESDAWAIHKSAPFLVDGSFKFRIADIQSMLFPTGIFILCLDMEPEEEVDEEHMVKFVKLILSSFIRTGRFFSGGEYESKKFERVFGDPRQEESVKRRFGENTELNLVRGLCGETLRLPDLVESLLPPEQWKFLMGDRFLVNALLKTSWDGTGEAFTTEDYVELVRLSRGQSDNYIPDARFCRPGSNGILKTFENVAFAASGEGFACWIKPADAQTFLQAQFKDRFARIYLLLYVLALHQRYALVALSLRLDEITPSGRELRCFMEAWHGEEIERTARQLQGLRSEAADFYLRAFFGQPAVLTNHQEFYSLLESVLGVRELLAEVQQAVPELDHLIDRLHHQKTETLEHQKKDNKFLLAVIAEIVAIPYYSFNFLAHVFHEFEAHPQPEVSLACSLALTALAVWATTRGFYRHRIEPYLRRTS